MSKVTLYHNPRCSKSREALHLLEEAGAEAEIIRYLDDPPNRAALDALVALGVPASALLRENEPEAAEAGVSAASADPEILDAIVRYPKLLQRPIAVTGERAIIGRPPERVLEIL